MFLCSCSCGNSLQVSLEHLRSGHTKSCGCYQKLSASDSNTTHGKYKGAGNTHKYHNLWRALITRCEKDINYKHLAHSERFLKDPLYFYEYLENNLGDRPEGYSLDRINTHKGYVEGNLRWASYQTQAQNTRGVKGVSSSYKGVCYYIKNSKWGASIRRDGKLYYLGLFDKEIDAAKAYVTKHLELGGMEVTEDNINYFINYFKNEG